MTATLDRAEWDLVADPVDNSARPKSLSTTARFHWEPKQDTLIIHRVPAWRKLAYGAGGLTDFYYLNILLGLANQIYVTGMHMDPAQLGIALAIPRIVGAIADPLVGNASDNSRSRWGRRRPFILVGGILGGLLLPLLWCVPGGSALVRFIYVSGMISLFSAMYSVFSVPYNALGYELSTDYDERTRVLAWKGYIQTIGTFSAAWFYWFCLQPIFSNEVIGARWLSVIAGIVMIGGTLATVWACREKTEQQRQPAIPLLQALKRTLRNKPFLILQASSQLMAMFGPLCVTIGWYVHLNYVCGSDKVLASRLTGFGGTMTIITAIAAIPLGLWLSTHMGKKEGALAGMLIVLANILTLPFVLTPAHPWWSVVGWVISALGMPCATLLFGSLTADICDHDELATGLRREGAFCAVNGFLGKVLGILALLGGGLMPRLVGYVDSSLPPSAELLVRMKFLMIIVQFLCVAPAVTIMWFYPLDRAASEKTRELLDARRRAKRGEVMRTEAVQQEELARGAG